MRATARHQRPDTAKGLCTFVAAADRRHRDTGAVEDGGEPMERDRPGLERPSDEQHSYTDAATEQRHHHGAHRTAPRALPRALNRSGMSIAP